MRTLTHCPACRTANPMPTEIPTNVSPRVADRFGAGVVADGKYAVCRRCDLLFARQRQDQEDAAAYYRAFRILEQRDYAVYPPPSFFLAQQRRFSDRLLHELNAAGALDDCKSAVNVRCENGTHLARLRDQHGVRDVYGLDHFDSNLRYAREQLGLEHLALLDPANPSANFEREHYDLVLANHQVTHALNPLSLLERFRSWLAPGGTLVLYNENDHRRYLRKRTLYGRGVGNYHKQLLTRRSLHNLCRLAGLKWVKFVHRKCGFKWAAPNDTMLVITQKDTPVTVQHLPETIGSPTRRRIAVGRSLYRTQQASHRILRVQRRPAA